MKFAAVPLCLTDDCKSRAFGMRCVTKTGEVRLDVACCVACGAMHELTALP